MAVVRYCVILHLITFVQGEIYARTTTVIIIVNDHLDRGLGTSILQTTRAYQTKRMVKNKWENLIAYGEKQMGESDNRGSSQTPLVATQTHPFFCA